MWILGINEIKLILIRWEFLLIFFLKQVQKKISNLFNMYLRNLTITVIFTKKKSSSFIVNLTINFCQIDMSWENVLIAEQRINILIYAKNADVFHIKYWILNAVYAADHQ